MQNITFPITKTILMCTQGPDYLYFLTDLSSTMPLTVREGASFKIELAAGYGEQWAKENGIKIDEVLPFNGV
jgi:hypothetical protein